MCLEPHALDPRARVRAEKRLRPVEFQESARVLRSAQGPAVKEAVLGRPVDRIDEPARSNGSGLESSVQKRPERQVPVDLVPRGGVGRGGGGGSEEQMCAQG